ncbi:DUF58 domain-containing protein [Halobacteriales archaeon Cl-PHB]
MRLTRRGWGAALLVLLAVGLAWQAGQRELNAIAAPVLAALLLAVVLVWRTDPPEVDRDRIRPGFPGEHRRDVLTLEGSGVVSVRERRPASLGVEDVDGVVTLPHSLETDLELARRGAFELGPPTVAQRDPLGLVARRVDTDAAVEVVVYPRIHDLGGRGSLAALLADELLTERQEFDRLREYVPGDPLKNVHWKSSAKHDDFLVMEFAPTKRTEQVTVVADAAEGCADEMAAAAASVADLALEADLSVALTLPDHHLPPGAGETHREHALGLLARAGAGDVPDTVHAEADVSIRATPDETRIRVVDRSTTLESLLVGGTDHRPEVNVR